MKRKACAFTGHRPQKFPWGKNEEDPACIALKNALNGEIVRLISEGYTDFLSGMALGVDIWAASFVLALRKENPALKLHCILPCTTQADRWTKAERKLYREILNEADSIVYVNRQHSRSCMLERNRFMVNYAALVLAVYNGERRGGTASTVRYARKQGRELLILHPVTLQVVREAGT